MSSARPHRAAPLPPDERRAALIAATLPLVQRHGADVSTRQIAEAAGVAEGTIFRVFASKDELVRAAVVHAFDQSSALAELAAVDRTLPLDDRLVQVTRLLQQRLTTLFRLLDAAGMTRPPDEAEDATRRAREVHRARGASHERVVAALAEIVAPDRDRLACEPEEVARRLRLITFAGSHPGITDGHPMTPEEIVSTLLDGVRRHGTCDRPHPRPTRGTTC